MSSFVQTFGAVRTSVNNKNKRSEQVVKWVGDYDGNIADVKLAVNNNGDMENIRIQMDNEDLINMLNIPSQNAPLDERISADFLPTLPTKKRRAPCKKTKKRAPCKRKTRRRKKSTRTSKSATIKRPKTRRK